MLQHSKQICPDPDDILNRMFSIQVNTQRKEIDLSNSCLVCGTKKISDSLSSESYELTFKTKPKSYAVMLTYDELIPDEEKQALFDEIKVEIDGDGTLFQIKTMEEDLELIFDRDNSLFVDNDRVKDGVIRFKK